MVARKVLDGLRKGKKDVYALNIQYVKRYHILLRYRVMHLFSQHVLLYPREYRICDAY